jgi:hypothetical protein
MSNQSAYSLTLKNSIARCMTGITASNIIDLVVSSSSRRLTLTLSSSSSSSSLLTSYTVSTTETGVTYSSLSSQLSTNIENGEFDGFLNYYATVYNTPGFVNATSSTVTTVNDLAAPPSSNDATGLNDGEIAGIVIGVTAAVALCCALSYYFIYYQSSILSKQKSSTSRPGGGKASTDEDLKKTEMRPSTAGAVSAPRHLSDSSISTMDTVEAPPVVGMTHNVLHEVAPPVASGIIEDKAEK